MAQVQTRATDRISGPMQEQIKHLLEAGHSIRKVAQALGVSRQVVRKFGRDETRIEDEIVAQVVSLPIKMESAKWAHPIDWLAVRRSVSGGPTIQQAHAERAPE